MMDVAHAKQATWEWIDSNIAQWPGLRGAHLVGGITSMADDALFPPHKDVDLHLIFDEGSPALQSGGPFMNVLEVSCGGISIEAGIKSVVDYRSPEAVLSNPEIAHHLTVDSLLYDPSSLLCELQCEVRRDYPRRRWVRARLDYERQGIAGAFAMIPKVGARLGASGEANIFGYTTTFLPAVLSVATLNAPRMGGRMLLRLRANLAAYDRLDLYEEILALLGLSRVGRAQVEQFFREATEGFDLAVEVKQSPHPFQHKLHRHLRPYFVETVQGMLDEGNHREAMYWVWPYHLSTADVILADGPEAEKPTYAARQAAFLRALGMDDDIARAATFAHACRLYDRVFAFAGEIVASHPEIVD